MRFDGWAQNSSCTILLQIKEDAHLVADSTMFPHWTGSVWSAARSTHSFEVNICHRSFAVWPTKKNGLGRVTFGAGEPRERVLKVRSLWEFSECLFKRNLVELRDQIYSWDRDWGVVFWYIGVYRCTASTYSVGVLNTGRYLLAISKERKESRVVDLKLRLKTLKAGLFFFLNSNKHVKKNKT